jgi:hypothetical protein
MDLMIQGFTIVSIGAIITLLFRVNIRLKVLEANVALPLWSVLQREVTKALHHPHPESQEMDNLLIKLENLQISGVETTRLNVLLDEKMNDEKQPDGERKRAELLRFIMPRVVMQTADIEELKKRKLSEEKLDDK